MYALKTDTKEGHSRYSNLYYFKDYKNYKTTKQCKMYRVDQSLGHFKVDRGQAYDMIQDICYAKKCLYIVTSKMGDPIEKNRILCVNSALTGKGLKPSTVIEITKPKKTMAGNDISEKFEAEGIAIESDGTIIIGANCTKVNDGVFIAIN